jgi:HSP20 family protein
MALPAAEATGFIPCVDLRETDGHYEVTAELPGVKPEDVKVSVSGDVLTVEGEKRAEKEEETAEGHMVERSFGTFRRSFRLPIDPDPDKVSATQEAGVLKVQIPKRQESGGTKQIEVKSA